MSYNKPLVSFSSVSRTRFGDSENYSYFTDEGDLQFAGNARPIILHPIHSLMCEPTHHSPLRITSLAALDGIVTDGLDTAAGNSRRIEVVGVDGGVHVKGRLKAAYSQEDTTNDSYLIQIKLNTTNATWEQAAGWRLKLDILAGNITGDFTVFMPAFSLMEYSGRSVYVTQEGAVYLEKTDNGFDKSLAGPAAASEVFINNESASGSPVVIEVASTTGFYVGNEVFISDDDSSEWARITAISADASITVDALTNSYTTAKNAKLDILDYTKTVSTRPVQRGMLKTKIFKAGENSGVSFLWGIPHTIDPTSDINVVFQGLPTADNASSHVSKWRVQYLIYSAFVDIPESIQYGTLEYKDITPAATKANFISYLCTIPAATHAGKHVLGVQISRMGSDAGDTYTGDVKLLTFVLEEITKQLGYETS